MTRKFVLILCGVVLAAGAGAYAAYILIPTQVEVVRPVRGAAVEAVYATGTVEPAVEVPVAPRVAARIVALPVDEGARVHKGDVLVQLEDTEYTANLAELRANYDYALQDFERKTRLHAAKSVSVEAFEQAVATRDAAKAKLDKAISQAAYLTLVAPADGLLTRRDGEVGEFIPVGQPIFYLSCCAPLRITAEVDEEDIPRVVVGQKVLIQNDAFADKVFNGAVTAITPRGDSTARSYRVRIGFDADATPLMIGMTAETNIILREDAHALLLPRAALGLQDKVQVVDDGGRVTLVAPTLGSKGAETIEIISGVAEDDVVITPYNADIVQGDAVRFDQP